MSPQKIAAGVLILLGVVFRGISLAHYRMQSKQTPSVGIERRVLERKKQRALYIDYAFIAIGVYLLVA